MSEQQFPTNSSEPSAAPQNQWPGDLSGQESSNQAAQTLKWVNRAVATGLVICFGAFAYSAVQSRLPPAGKRPKCGVDWLLWASGSKETFNSMLTKKIEEGSHEWDKLNKDKPGYLSNGSDLSKYVSGPLKFDQSIDLDKLLNLYKPSQNVSSKSSTRTAGRRSSR